MYNKIKQHLHTQWTDNRLLFVSSVSIFVFLLIPYFSILLIPFALPFFIWGILKQDYAKKMLKGKHRILRVLVIPAGMFVFFLLFFTIIAVAYTGILFPADLTIQNEIVETIPEPDPRIAELELKAKEEEQKRVEAENAKKELEDKIANAQKINPEIDFDSELEAQDVALAVQANNSIAKLGNNTKDQKLFDVLSVVDGDTIKVSELGTLRLIGIDTPETKDPRKPVQCYGAEASNKAKELLQGQQVYLEFDPANRIDRYGRTLAYVYRADNLAFNSEMIKQGFANSYTKYPHPRLAEYNDYQTQSRNSQIGLWSPATCNGDTTQAATPAPTPVAGTPPKKTTSSSSSKSSTAPKPAPTTTAPSGYVAGTCAYLKSIGLGNKFRPGDPNYTPERDRDSDGVACES